MQAQHAKTMQRSLETRTRVRQQLFCNEHEYVACLHNSNETSEHIRPVAGTFFLCHLAAHVASEPANKNKKLQRAGTWNHYRSLGLPANDCTSCCPPICVSDPMAPLALAKAHFHSLWVTCIRGRNGPLSMLEPTIKRLSS